MILQPAASYDRLEYAIDARRSTDTIDCKHGGTATAKNHAETDCNGNRLEAWGELTGKVDVASGLQRVNPNQHRFTETVLTDFIETEGEADGNTDRCA